MSTLLEAIAGAGYQLPRKDIICDGKLHRFATDPNKNYSSDGWYIVFDDARGKVGAFGSWRDGSSIKWSNRTGISLTKEQKLSFDQARKAGFEEHRKEKEEASLRAKRLYEQASPSGESGYLAKKGITQPEGSRFITNMSRAAFGYKSQELFSGLIIPVYSSSGVIATLQLISDDGDKKFMPKGSTSAGWFAVGDWVLSRCVVIAEGVATAQSIHQATQLPVLTAFSANNIACVAKMVRAANVTTEILLAVDGDKSGRDACEKAAQQSNCRLIEAPDGMDWNDVHAKSGLNKVKAAFVTEEIDSLWKSGLIVKTKSDGTETIPCRVHNLILILSNDPAYKGKIKLNEMTNQLNIGGIDADEAGVTKIKAWLEKNYISEKVTTGDVIEALTVVAEGMAFHPVREYLASLKWDGTARVSGLFADYFGATDDAYTMAVSKSFMLSAVARVMRPGCQVDTMVVLEGEQGGFKSSALAALFSPAWHSEITASVTDKDFFQNLRGKWLMEFGEMTHFKKSDAALIKQIITARFDNYRASYARFNRDYPRQSIFAGTTNESSYLTDPTGARRFLPVLCRTIQIEAIKSDRNQLWAEALRMFNAGEKWWDIPDSGEAQDDRYQADSWEEKVAAWLDGKISATTSEILEGALELPPGKHSRAEQTRIGAIMTRMKWNKRRDLIGGVRIWRYYRF